MRWQHRLGIILVPLGVSIVVLAAMLAANQSNPAANSGDIGDSNGTDIGGAIMLDPQGDRELARLVLMAAVESGTPQVILSRRVIGGELACLGFEWANGFERQAVETFGLVVLHGKLRRMFPGSAQLPHPEIAAYIYEFQHKMITAQGGPDWSSLRAAYGSAAWPEDSGMYVSPDGQPSIFELGFHFRERGSSEAKGQVVDMSQEAGGWKVKVVRVYAAADHVTIGYTVIGPHVRFKIDQPVLKIGGKSLRSTYWGLEYETTGPSVATATFWGVPEATQPQELAMHFEVPALHVRPPKYPCEMPNLKPEEYPTPTRIPDEIDFDSPRATPEPDLKSFGPFTFDLNVNVEPRPTKIPFPTPVPTIEMPFLPTPQSTGQP